MSTTVRQLYFISIRKVIGLIYFEFRISNYQSKVHELMQRCFNTPKAVSWSYVTLRGKIYALIKFRNFASFLGLPRKLIQVYIFKSTRLRNWIHAKIILRFYLKCLNLKLRIQKVLNIPQSQSFYIWNNLIWFECLCIMIN